MLPTDSVPCNNDREMDRINHEDEKDANTSNNKGKEGERIQYE